ncbi:hypothetical protein A6B40_00675 [Mannheimia varigena]|uniref:barstar family protein n=1 Tax=Mannheimia varigena TaxID=85404 RepID=UPI00159D00EF|nr:barstar family protein [Mannheimia varigena]QLB16202.1 hypothetical protein A6B40_00675 [Mannheimia varigena]
MEVVIDLQKIKSPHDFYEQLTQQVDFGAFFGRNLDAFWDILTCWKKKILFINFSLLDDDIYEFIINIVSMINEYNLEKIKLRLRSREFIHLNIYSHDTRRLG